MSTASLHVLPSCPPERIFELRRNAARTGAQLIRYTLARVTQPAPAPADRGPFGGDAA